MFNFVITTNEVLSLLYTLEVQFFNVYNVRNERKASFYVRININLLLDKRTDMVVKKFFSLFIISSPTIKKIFLQTKDMSLYVILPNNFFCYLYIVIGN